MLWCAERKRQATSRQFAGQIEPINFSRIIEKMFCLTRYLLIALMLVLLPLRGWAGNIMAVDMAATAAIQVKMAHVSNQAAMPVDCAMHAQPSTDDAATLCGSCDTCELCLAVANLTLATWAASPFMRHTSPLAINASFRSASSASSLKPPIS